MLTASAASINEGETNTFTVTASEAVAADTTVTFQLRVDATGDTAQAADFNAGAFNPVTATIKAGQTAATFGLSTITNDGTEVSEKYTVEAAVNGQTLSKQVTILDGAIGGGQTFQLTKGLDSIPGLIGSNGNTSNSGDDTILASVSGTNAELNTMSSIDVINGGSGINTLKISAETALTNANLATLSNVQNIEVAASADATVDTSSIAGVTSLKATKAGANLTLKAASTTAIDASGVTGTAGVTGVKEEFTATFVGTEIGSDTTIAFDGVTATLAAAAGGTALATDFVGDYNGAGTGTWDAVDNGDGSVTFTAKVAGAKTDVVSAGFVVTPNTADGVAVAVTAAAPSTQGVTSVTASVATIDGGSSQTVSVAKGAVTVGATTVTTGAISVTNASQGVDAIAVDGGAAVTVTTTGSTGGTVTVGQGGAAADLATGAVAVTSTQKAIAATDVTLGAVTVTGGSTVTVTQVSDTSKAATDKTGATLTQGAVNVTAGTATTAVTVNQAKSTAEVVAVDAVAGVTESSSVKFGALKSGDSIILGTTAANDALAANELQFTAAKDLTAEEVAQAFASLTAADYQAGGKVVNGVYSVDAGLGTLPWTSGAASGDTVVFTSTSANTAVDNLVVDLVNTSTTSVDAVNTPSAVGSAATAAKTGVLGVQTGAVSIDDNATAASITTVTLDSYGATTIGNVNTLSKLATLNLSNSGSTGTAGETDAAVAVDAAGVTTLALTLNNVKGAVTLDAAPAASVAALNITTSGADSSFALTAAAVKNMTIAGDKKATLSAGTFTALETVTVSGTASAVFDNDEADTLTAVNSSATTGAVTVGINGAKATYTGGAGVDTVTLNTGTSLTKAIDLGLGDDTLSFGAITVATSTAALNGGDGTDTLVMNTAAAAALDDSAQTFYTNFERLTVSDTSTATLNLANLGFTNYVTTTGSGATLTLINLASNGTVVLTAKATTSLTVAVKDAATGLTDVVNAIAQTNETSAAVDGTNNASADLGTFTVANVETVNVTFNDANLDDDGDGISGELNGAGTTDDELDVGVLILAADTAATVTVTGNTSATLDLSGAVKTTLVDASTLTGGLTLVADGAAAGTEVRGALGNDVLTASGENDVLKGNAGTDTFNLADLTSAYGGTGSDIFNFAVNSNLTKVSKVYEVGTGDVFNLVDVKNTDAKVDKFYASGAQYTPDTTTDVTGKVNAALVQTGAGEASWFNHAGNTYIVIDNDSGAEPAAGAVDTYSAGNDIVIQVIGEFNLGTVAAFNKVSGTLEML